MFERSSKRSLESIEFSRGNWSNVTEQAEEDTEANSAFLAEVLNMQTTHTFNRLSAVGTLVNLESFLKRADPEILSRLNVLDLCFAPGYCSLFCFVDLNFHFYKLCRYK